MYLWIMKKKIKIQELIQIQAVDYRIKRTIDMDNKQNNSININNMSLDLEKDNLYKKISTGIDPKLSYNNLRNSNGLQLNDNEKIINDEFKFQSKIINQYNPFKDKTETIKSPPYKNEKEENKNINIKHFKGKEAQLINPPQKY